MKPDRCPLCGNEVDLNVTAYTTKYGAGSMMLIECRECGLTLRSKPRESEQQFILRWNRRVLYG